MVTNEAITTMYEGMRTLSGMKRAMAEIVMLERISTIMVARPMPRPLMAEVVVPSVGHIPRTSTNVGLFLTMPSTISWSLLFLLIVLGI